MSSCWGWLAPELASFANVFSYDRAGLGWSEPRQGLRSAKELARELHDLLLALKLRPPFVLLGHSMGALVNRAFLKLFPHELAALVWIDPAHPAQMTRNKVLGARLKAFFITLEAAHLFAARNLPRIEQPFLQMIKGLPKKDFKAARFFFRYPRHLQASSREARSWDLSCKFVEGTSLCDLPLLVISAQKKALPGWAAFQAELAQLSTRSRHLTFTDASHASLLSNHEHAARVTTEIRAFLNDHALL